ncbi:MAG: type II toxin-antitoxin system PemK/MazF family toxin [Segetibacter sp.]|jgi:mRNA interferase MazF|nr:type II toxin-antitoxin system PemK/MazF family toxin [Segetibacter sp.]
MMQRQFEVWVADLDPQFGTEAGKKRPVVIIQNNLLNQIHPSTIVCPVTTNVQPKANILRVHLKKGEANVKLDSDILVDQIRAIDNKRLIKRTGVLSTSTINELTENLRIVLDL